VLYIRPDQKWLTCSLQCVPDKDCCFSTKGACQRQASVWIEKYFQCGQVKKCPDYGVSLQDCVSVFLLFCLICLRADVFSFRMRTAVAYLRKEVAVALVNKWDRLSQYRSASHLNLSPASCCSVCYPVVWTPPDIAVMNVATRAIGTPWWIPLFHHSDGL
jgi:hypothetical protein